MRTVSLTILGACLTAVSLQAQNPPAPAAIERKLDTPQARVIVATLQPHTPSVSRNGHATNRLLIYLDDGVMTRKEGDKTTKIEFHRGDVRWRPASGAYVAENVGDTPFRILEVDLKGPPAGPLPVTALDPVNVDKAHYKVEFENESVRVLRIRFGPHDKGARHDLIDAAIGAKTLPLVGRVGREADGVGVAQSSENGATPTPGPSPQGGGERA